MRDAIRDVLRQVQAPDWAAANLDGLADVLRDLSWLPPGPLAVRVPAGAGEELVRVLADVEVETAKRPHPVRVIVG